MSEFNSIEQLKSQLRLPETAKSRIRSGLVAAMQQRPVRGATPVRQLLQRPFLFIHNLKPMQLAVLVSLAVFLTGGSVSLAAEGALPGDILYPVKVNVNEQVRGSFALTTEAQAAWEVERAERRLAEMTRLAAEGKLDVATRSRLENEFKDQTGRAALELKALHDASGQTGKAAELTGELEASLRAHAAVLGAVSAGGSANAQVRADIAKELRGILQVVTPLRTQFEADDNAQASTPDQRGAASGKITAAANVIAATHGYIERKQAALGITVATEAEVKLDEARQAHAAAQAKFEAQAYAEAFFLASSAERLAHEAKATVDVQGLIHGQAEMDVDIETETGTSSSSSGKRSGLELDLGL